MKSIVTAADSGDRLEALKVLRHKLAVTIRETKSARELPPLSRQLREVMEEIESITAPQAEETEPEKNVSVLELVRKKHEA